MLLIRLLGRHGSQLMALRPECFGVLTDETRDGGGTWLPRGEGLRDREAYLTVVRRAFDRAGEGPQLQLDFGATSGDVFGSGDAGGGWFTAATRLPPVFSVTAS